MVPLEKVLETIATLCSGIFSGAAAYINLVEHPARMECGAIFAATEFGPSYRRAAVMQASLAAIGFLAAMASWLMGSSFWFLVAGLLLVSVIPFTLIAVMPTNRILLYSRPDSEYELSGLLTRWNRLHTVRTVLGLVSFLVFVLVG